MLTLLLACKPPLSDYTLTIVPVLLESQAEDLLAFEPDIKVSLTYPDGVTEIRYAGQASAGAALTLDALPPLPVDTQVGLIAERPGGAQDVWNPKATLAFGEGRVTEDLADGEKQLQLEVNLVRVDSIAKLGTLKATSRKIGGAMAMVPGGAVYVFGGGDPEDPGTIQGSSPPLQLSSSDTVLRLEPDVDGAWTDLEEVGQIPSFDTPVGGFVPGVPEEVPAYQRVEMTATTVTIDDQPYVFVAGGRYTYSFTAYNTSGWFLWDPVADEVFQKSNADNPLFASRSAHLALPLGASKVLLFGGLTGLGYGPPATFEIWSGATRDSELGTNAGNPLPGSLYAFGAPLGNDAVICGGYSIQILSGVHDIWTPLDSCLRFRPNNRTEAIARLPVLLGAASMAPLPDGGLLVTGGSNQVMDNDGAAITRPARAQAYRWNPDDDEWAEIASMTHPRAHHASMALGDGRVMIIGGTEIASTLYGPVTGPVRCIELFDPDDNTFTEGDCTDAGSGAKPAYATWPGEGISVLEGGHYESNVQLGGGVPGVTARFPRFEP